MMVNVKKSKKPFCSINEYEKKYFPIAHAKKLEKIGSDERGVVGTGLATELLNDIKQAASQK